MRSVAGESVCEILPWDSQFFGFSIGRVRGDTLTYDQLVEVDRWSRKEKVAGLYFLARADSPDTIEVVQNAGFRLVDIRITLEHKNDDANFTNLPKISEAGARAARLEDVPVLQAIARTAHTDTRFFIDPHFTRAKAEALYSLWIELECQGRAQHVMVPISDTDKPLGYISCHLDAGHSTGQIGLVGIESGARGRGLAKAVVKEALRWFQDQNAKSVTVVTQGRNLAAQRLYQRCGFVTCDLQLWYHKWYSEPVI
jgi:dTDP-4-amino-4,6-dideoxy-D-galactose acyltransferase